MSKVLQPKQQLGAPTNYSLASCILLILLLLPLLQFASYALNWFPFADSGFVQLSALHYSKLVNFSSNSFVYWRQDLLLSAIAGQKYWLYMTLCYLVLASGCVLWLKQPRLWTSLTFCFLITLVLYATFALDTVVLQTCMWLPWLAVTLRKTRLAPARPALHRALFLLTCIKYLDAANQFSLLGLGIITAIEYKFDKSTWPKASKLGLVSMYACAALVTILISCPTSPRYPAQEKLVPDDGIPFTVRPHLGPELPIQVLNHAHIADSVLLPATILILFALLCLVWQKANEPYARTLAFSSLVVSICTLLHTSMFPAELNQIAPLSALSRLIPGWSFYDLTILSLCIAMLLLGVSLTLQRRFWIFGGWIAISLLAATLHQDRSGNRTHFSLLRYDIKRPWTWDSALSAPQSARHDLQTLLSPS